MATADPSPGLTAAELAQRIEARWPSRRAVYYALGTLRGGKTLYLVRPELGRGPFALTELPIDAHAFETEEAVADWIASKPIRYCDWLVRNAIAPVVLEINAKPVGAVHHKPCNCPDSDTSWPTRDEFEARRRAALDGDEPQSFIVSDLDDFIADGVREAEQAVRERPVCPDCGQPVRPGRRDVHSHCQTILTPERTTL